MASDTAVSDQEFQKASLPKRFTRLFKLKSRLETPFRVSIPWADRAQESVSDNGSIPNVTLQAQQKGSPTQGLDKNTATAIQCASCGGRERDLEVCAACIKAMKYQLQIIEILSKILKEMIARDEITRRLIEEAPKAILKTDANSQPDSRDRVLAGVSSRPSTVTSLDSVVTRTASPTTTAPFEEPPKAQFQTSATAPKKHITKSPSDVRVSLTQVERRNSLFPTPGVTVPVPSREEIASHAPCAILWVQQICAKYSDIGKAISSKDKAAALASIRELSRAKLQTRSRCPPRVNFSSLPLELRNQIYQDYFTDLLSELPCFNLNTLRPPSLTQVSRSLRHESSTILFSNFPFSICYTVVPKPKPTIFNLPNPFIPTSPPPPPPSPNLLRPGTSSWLNSLPPHTRKIRDLRISCKKAACVPHVFHLRTHRGTTTLHPFQETYKHNGMELPLLPLIAHPDGNWVFDAQGRVTGFAAQGGVEYGYGIRGRNEEIERLRRGLKCVLGGLVGRGVVGVGAEELEGLGGKVREVCEASGLSGVVI